MGELKTAISKELRKKLDKWDHEHQGVLVRYTGRKQILNGGRGRIIDTNPFIFITVRYTAQFAKPYVGAKVRGTIQRIGQENGTVCVICTLEGGLSAMADNIDEQRFELKAEAISTYMPKANESDSELVSSDEDSIFQEDNAEKAVKFSLLDKKKGKDL